jgi:hypothetical protein
MSWIVGRRDACRGGSKLSERACCAGEIQEAGIGGPEFSNRASAAGMRISVSDEGAVNA